MHQIKKISALHTSKFVAIVYAPIGLIHTLIGITLFNNGKTKYDVIGYVLLAMPFFIALIMFVMMFLLSKLHNWIASKIGGVEFELDSV